MSDNSGFHGVRKQILTEKLTREDYKNVFRFAADILKDGLGRKQIVTLVASCLISIAYSVLLPIINGAITDYAVKVYNGTDTAFVLLIVFIILLPLMTTLSAAVSYLNAKIMFSVTKYLDLTVKSKVMDKLAHVKLDYFNDPSFAEKQLFINVKATDCFSEVVIAAITLLTSLVGVVSSLVVIFVNYPLAGVICLVAAIPLAFFANNINENLYFRDYWEIPEYKKMSYAFEISSDGKHAEERLLYDYAPETERRFDSAYRDLKKLRDKAAGKSTMNRVFSNLFAAAALAAVLMLVTRDILSSALAVGVFSLMLSAVQTFFSRSQSLFFRIFRLRVSAKYGKSVLDISELEDEPTESDNTRSIDPDNMDIEISGLRFSYPGMNEEVIKGIDLKIRQGEKIAIVGKNGSGKSTLVSLLTGMYPPGSGDIKFNGIPLRECLESVRRATACIFQNFNQYEMSIADNILVGDLTREVSREELEELCDKTGITGFAREFPDGIDTVLGSIGEAGANLSGGQWQRVMMARAMIRKNASLLVFDEPTAALDPKAEAELYNEFSAITGSRTTLTVSHRLGITSAVDRILVMDDGRIVEDGTHDELMAENGLYAKMWGAQAQWYV